MGCALDMTLVFLHWALLSHFHILFDIWGMPFYNIDKSEMSSYWYVVLSVVLKFHCDLKGANPQQFTNGSSLFWSDMHFNDYFEVIN